MKRTTAPKHKTPNYRLVTRTHILSRLGRTVIARHSDWEAVPLRADRRDLKVHPMDNGKV